jgi:hypothetical protein
MAMLARLLCLAVTLVAATATAEAAYISFYPDPSGAITFVMPSGNIDCIYTPAGGSGVYVPPGGGPELSCDRAQPIYLRFVLENTGPAQMIGNVGDPGCCGGTNGFPYGMTWRMAPFTCTSSTKGLTCTRDDGHGFFISKAKVQAY